MGEMWHKKTSDLSQAGGVKFQICNELTFVVQR